MNETDKLVTAFCEYFPNAADCLSRGVEMEDAQMVSRIVESRAGALVRQLDYATQVVAYGPSTASTFRHYCGMMHDRSPERMNGLREAYRVGRAIVRALRRATATAPPY